MKKKNKFFKEQKEMITYYAKYKNYRDWFNTKQLGFSR